MSEQKRAPYPTLQDLPRLGLWCGQVEDLFVRRNDDVFHQVYHLHSIKNDEDVVSTFQRFVRDGYVRRSASGQEVPLTFTTVALDAICARLTRKAFSASPCFQVEDSTRQRVSTFFVYCHLQETTFDSPSLLLVARMCAWTSTAPLAYVGPQGDFDQEDYVAPNDESINLT